MATLEKIRSKSVLLFTIIIVALLAFILGDFFTSGRSLFGPGDTMAKANGAKVNLSDYQERTNAYNDMLKAQGQSVNPDEINQTAIMDLMREALLAEEYDRLGIVVTDKELQTFMLGEAYAPRVMQSLAANLGVQPQMLAQMGMTSPQIVYDAIKNPQKFGMSAQDAKLFEDAWVKTEKDVEDNIMLGNYMNLLGGLFTANRIDAKNTYNDRNTTTTFAYVAKDYTSVPDDKVKITDADYEAVYNERKGSFKLQEDKRYISYITVSMEPSEADRKKVDTDIQSLVGELNATEGTDAVRKFRGFSTRNGKYTRQMLAQDNDLRTLSFSIDSLKAGAVQQLPTQGTHYALAKLTNVTTGIDTLKFSIIPVQDVAKLDSVMASVTVATIDSLAGPMANQQMSLVKNEFGLSDNLLEKFAVAPLNQIVALTDTVDSADGKQPVAFVVDVKHRSATVPVYEIATVTYDLTPSDATLKDVAQQFRNYVANNSKSDAFAKNAAKAGYVVGHALVSPSDPIGPAAPGSMSVVKWVMDADKGQVSKVYSLTRPTTENGSNQYLIAVALDEIYEDDYIPANSAYVKDLLKPYVTDRKKAQIVMDQVKNKAKSLEEYATQFGTTVANASSAFGENSVGGLMASSPELQAAIATAKPGTLVGPIRGNGSIFYIQVSESKTQGRPFNFNENAQTYLQRTQAPMLDQTVKGYAPSLMMLIGDNKVTNNLLEFTSAAE